MHAFPAFDSLSPPQPSEFTIENRRMPQPSDAKVASIAQQAILTIAKCQLPPNPSVFTVMYRYFEGAHADLIEALRHRIDDPAAISLNLIESLFADHFATASPDNQDAIADRLDDGIDDVRSIMDEQKRFGVAYSDKLDQAQKILAGADAQQATNAVHQLSQDTRSMQQQIAGLQRRVDEAKAETTALKAKLVQSQAAMMTDHLTGLGNRRFYEATLKRAVKDVDTDPVRAFLALVDCDKFKSINDTFGHPFGDQVIKRLGKLMRESSTEASIARLGGDEFAVFIRCNHVDDVQAFADRFRDLLNSQPIVSQKTGETLQRICVSIGIAAIRPTDDAASWHERADRLLYKAKRLGGDRAVIESVAGGS